MSYLIVLVATVIWVVKLLHGCSEQSLNLRKQLWHRSWALLENFRLRVIYYILLMLKITEIKYVFKKIYRFT